MEDVARLEDLDRLYREVDERFGRIDVLFVNAGFGCGKQRYPVHLHP